jgi:hypothetical protein
MKRITLVLVAIAMAGVGTAWQSSSTRGDAQPAPQSAKEVRGASPYIEIKNEPAPKLIVDEPLPDGLPQGIVWIQYRTESILPVSGRDVAILGALLLNSFGVATSDSPFTQQFHHIAAAQAQIKTASISGEFDPHTP